MSGFLSSCISMGGMVVSGILGGLITGGNPAGIAVGATLGGMVFGFAGQYLLPGATELSGNPPPQPHENRIQISTFGQSIPLVYESARLAGNVIYMQPVQRSVNRSRHRQDGVRYYEYVITYTSTFAIAFCEGPQEGICRIWVNGNLFADWRDPAGPYYPSGSVGLAAGNLATSIARQTVYFTIYTGTEAQTADTALSAILGAADTPSYKGICYIVFRDFPIGEFTGIPKIEVEIGPQVATDTCSEYFNGTNGDPIPTTIFDEYFIGGTPATIQGNKACFNSVDYEEIDQSWRTNFEFLGEFDVYLSFTDPVDNSGDDCTSSFVIEANNGSVVGRCEYYYSNDGSISKSYAKFPLPTGEYSTSDLSGKLRLVRDASNNLIAYVWNASSSQWEWDGNTSGNTIRTGFTGNVTIRIAATATAYLDLKTYIDDFVTVSGCDNTQPVGT